MRFNFLIRNKEQWCDMRTKVSVYTWFKSNPSYSSDLHFEYGPSMVGRAMMAYHNEDKLHRVDGPAYIIFHINKEGYFIKGKEYTIEEFNKATSSLE